MSHNHKWLDKAKYYADANSGCCKVKVGCVLVNNGEAIGYGANTSVPNICKTEGCLREWKYGNNNKTHRNPDDCRAVHSELAAITDAFKLFTHYDKYITSLTAYVTRYPCEACARMLVLMGVKRVVYGRMQEITPMTIGIFASGGVDVIWERDWTDEDVIN